MIALLCFTAFISIGFSSGNQKRQGQESTLRDQSKEQKRRGDLSGLIIVKYYYTESDTGTDSNYTEIQEVINALGEENGKCVELEKINDESKAGGVEINAYGRHIYKKYELERYEKSKFEEFFNYSIDLLRDRCVDLQYYVDPDSKADTNYMDIKKIVDGSKYKQNVHVEKRDNKSKAGNVRMTLYVFHNEVKHKEFSYEESKFEDYLNKYTCRCF